MLKLYLQHFNKLVLMYNYKNNIPLLTPYNKQYLFFKF